MATSPSRIARAGTEQRKPQILRRAAQLFQRKGFHATSMDEVANLLELNKATIYHHFPGGKSDLLFGIAITALQDLKERVEQLDRSVPPTQRLQELIRAMIDVQLMHADETVVYHEELRWLKELLPREQYRQLHSLERGFHRQVSDAIEHGVTSGVFRTCEVAVTATLVIDLTSSAYRTFRTGKRPDADTLTRRYTEFAIDGLVHRS